jgi:hypothetical protein
VRLAIRQARAKPLIDALHVWLEARRRRMLSGSPTLLAINYALGRWQGLTRFLDDGRIEIDNNTVERSMRPMALQRKNALFAGHDLGAENWAAIASLVETCKLNAINPSALSRRRPRTHRHHAPRRSARRPAAGVNGSIPKPLKPRSK